MNIKRSDVGLLTADEPDTTWVQTDNLMRSSKSQIRRVDERLVAENAEALLEGAQFSMVGYIFHEFLKSIGDVLVKDVADETIQ
jgi:hypothetical protein